MICKSYMMVHLTDLTAKSKSKFKKATLLQSEQANSSVMDLQESAMTKKNINKVSDWIDKLNKNHKNNKNLMKELTNILLMKT